MRVLLIHNGYFVIEKQIFKISDIQVCCYIVEI